jgi:uncharacterized repeat protein (TIGR03803 family)
MKLKKPRSAATARAMFCGALLLAGTLSAFGANTMVLHRFRQANEDGRAPYGRLISDTAGNLYGTTELGGMSGGGTVFELTKPTGPSGWTETVLYNFTGGADGGQPYGGVIFDSLGNLYGTTNRGGASDAGTVYQLAPPAEQGGSWTETVLYSFAGGTDGQNPEGDLTFDQAGNLYGTTTAGGSPGNGIVFELAPAQGGTWSETVLHSFFHKEGVSPRAAVLFDRHGSLSGTLANGGASGGGAVFRLDPPSTQGGRWTEKSLYRFSGHADGKGPLCTLVLFKGSLYGTTVIGGASKVGTIFQLTPPAHHGVPWTETVLHSFTCVSDGCYPWAGLTMDKKGAFYGTTQYGGLPTNGGTVFQLTQSGGVWTESVLSSFTHAPDQRSAAGVLMGKGGTLYGTTIGEKTRNGLVFKLHP